MANLSFQLKSENLDGFSSEDRQLLILAGARHLSVVLWDKPGKKIISIEEFTHIDDWEEEWPMILQRSSLLPFRHLGTEVFYTSERAILFPSIFYTPSSASAQLATICGEAQEIHSGADIFEEEGWVLAWETPSEIYETLSGHFHTVTHKSLAAVLLDISKKHLLNDACGQLIVTTENAWVSLWRSRQLLLLKTIPVNNPEDFAYQLLNICHQWGIDNEQIRWQVAGMIQTDAPLWQVPEQFFQHFEPLATGLSDTAGTQAHFYSYILEYLKPANPQNLAV